MCCEGEPNAQLRVLKETVILAMTAMKKQMAKMMMVDLCIYNYFARRFRDINIQGYQAF